ncbi:MAG: energy transducer TonB [Candidatus Aminicenantaceae bacterium]
MKIHYKIYSFEKEIKDVVIVPPETVVFPRNERILDSVRKNDAVSSDKEIYESFEQARLEEGNRIRSQNSSSSSLSEEISGYRTGRMILDIPKSFNFNKKEFPKETDNKKNTSDFDAYQYLYSHGSGRVSGEYDVFLRNRGNKGRVFAKSDSDANEKNSVMKKWGNEVIERVKNNWLISHKSIDIKKAITKISVIVKKDGILKSIEIVTSSHDQDFDSAALDAVKTSLPFPGLPDGFFEEDIEIYLLFQCND